MMQVEAPVYRRTAGMSILQIKDSGGRYNSLLLLNIMKYNNIGACERYAYRKQILSCNNYTSSSDCSKP